jgi:hypothetical protein
MDGVKCGEYYSKCNEVFKDMKTHGMCTVEVNNHITNSDIMYQEGECTLHLDRM